MENYTRIWKYGEYFVSSGKIRHRASLCQHQNHERHTIWYQNLSSSASFFYSLIDIVITVQFRLNVYRER